jgi:hypothetical protein
VPVPGPPGIPGTVAPGRLDIFLYRYMIDR